MKQASREQSRLELSARLRARLGEIEQAALNRIYAVSDPPQSAGAEYADGLRTAVSAAIEYGVSSLERGEQGAPPVPTVLFAQARLAARSGVNLDVVLRRYLTGYTLLGDFLIEEAEQGGLLEGAALKRLLRTQAVVFDRLIAAVGEEYAREAASRPDTSAKRRAQRVQWLLDGELLDASELGYELDGWHIGAIAKGHGAESAFRKLTGSLDCRLLLIAREKGTAWAWVSSRRRTDPSELLCRFDKCSSAGLALAIGEPAENLAGWRLSHRQAAAALTIAERGEGIVRYADVALLASAIRDDVLTASLRQLYLDPLEQGQDGGETARQTLRAYFAANGNISSAAAGLGVNRHTVASRLRSIEATLGRPLDVLAPDLEAALRIEELGLAQ